MEHRPPVHGGRQTIKARVQPDGSIIFADFSRGVDGLIAKPSVAIDSEQTLKTMVMRAYDRCEFRSVGGQLDVPHEAGRGGAMILVYLFVAFCALMYAFLAFGLIATTITRFVDDITAFFRARATAQVSADPTGQPPA